MNVYLIQYFHEKLFFYMFQNSLAILYHEIFIILIIHFMIFIVIVVVIKIVVKPAFRKFLFFLNLLQLSIPHLVFPFYFPNYFILTIIVIFLLLNDHLHSN